MPKCVKCERVFHLSQLAEGWCEKCQKTAAETAAEKQVAASVALKNEVTTALELISEQLAGILSELKVLNGIIREKVS